MEEEDARRNAGDPGSRGDRVVRASGEDARTTRIRRGGQRGSGKGACGCLLRGWEGGAGPDRRSRPGGGVRVRALARSGRGSRRLDGREFPNTRGGGAALGYLGGRGRRACPPRRPRSARCCSRAPRFDLAGAGTRISPHAGGARASLRATKGGSRDQPETSEGGQREYRGAPPAHGGGPGAAGCGRGTPDAHGTYRAPRPHRTEPGGVRRGAGEASEQGTAGAVARPPVKDSEALFAGSSSRGLLLQLFQRLLHVFFMSFLTRLALPLRLAHAQATATKTATATTSTSHSILT